MLLYLLAKPAGRVTARVDDRYPTVAECFPPELRDVLHPLGRLDKDTEGLLLFTNDGRLDARLMQPGRHVSKTYFFRALGDLTEEKVRALEEGVHLRRGDFTTAPARVTVTRRQTVADVAPWLPEDRKAHLLRNPNGAAVEGTIEITEGKWHQVKRMLKAVGCFVVYLRRDRLGPLSLGDLPAGAYRPLTAEETAALYAAAGLPVPETPKT